MATRANWLNDMPQQFQGKRNIEILIKAFERQLNELEAVFSDLDTKTDLDSAVGVNLDNVGGIVGLTRKEAGLLAGTDTVPSVMSDVRYRQFLRYKNLVNTNECTYNDLINGIELLWNYENMHYIEEPALPATVIFQTDVINIEELDFVEFHSKLCIRAAGVGLILRKRYAGFFNIPVKVKVPTLYIYGEMFLKNKIFLLDGTYFLDGGNNLSGYIDDGTYGYCEIDFTVKSYCIMQAVHEAMFRFLSESKIESKAAISYRLIQDIDMTSEFGHNFLLGNDIDVHIGSEAGLIVEKNLWFLDGKYLLDGEKTLNSEVYEINLE